MTLSAVADRDERGVAPQGPIVDKNIPTERDGPLVPDKAGYKLPPLHPSTLLHALKVLASLTLCSHLEKLSAHWAMTTCSGTQVSAFPRKSAPNQGSSSHRVPGPLPGAGQAQGTLQMGGNDEQPLVRVAVCLSGLSVISISQPCQNAISTPTG